MHPTCKVAGYRLYLGSDKMSANLKEMDKVSAFIL